MTVRSQNGYTANDRTRVKSRNVEGTNVNLTVRIGPAGDLLLDFAAEFDKIVQNIDNARGHLNDWGYAERPVRGSATVLSNHASGTAIDLNADWHPLGKRGTFSTAQVKAIHGLLEKYDHCIRWGGDYHNRADEMHFEIVVSEAKCKATINHIKGLEDQMASQEYKALAAENKRLKDEVAELRSILTGSKGIIVDAKGVKRNLVNASENHQHRLDTAGVGLKQ